MENKADAASLEAVALHEPKAQTTVGNLFCLTAQLILQMFELRGHGAGMESRM